MALNKSHMEKGLTQNLESLPTPHLTFNGGRVTASSHDERTPEEPSVIDEEGSRYTGSKTSEDATRSVGEEPKPEGVV